MRIPGVPYIQGRNSYDDKDDWKYGIAIHNTSNDASARNEAAYAQNRTDGVSAHLYVDKIEVIQSIDLLARTGHAGSSTGNENAISVEITGVNGWSRQTWIANVNWLLLGGALAWCCTQFGITVRRASVGEMQSNPKVKAFYSHDDMRRAWGGTDHTDPGGNFPWDILFDSVLDALGDRVAGGPDDSELEVDTMGMVFHRSGTGEKPGQPPALYAVAGSSPGTSANWLETTDYNFAVDLVLIHQPKLGRARTLSPETWDEWKARYLEPVSTDAIEISNEPAGEQPPNAMT